MATQDKRSVNISAFFDNIKKQCAKQGTQHRHPAPRSVSDLFAKYDATVCSTKTGDQQLKDTRDELVARIRGQDLHGRTLNRPGLPSEAELEALEAREAELFRPFAEDLIEVTNTRPDGTVVRKKYTVAQTMQALQQRTEEQSAELTSIHAEVEQISAEIDAIVLELETGSDADAERAKRELDAELERIEAAEKEAEEKYGADLAKLKKKEKEIKAEWERKLQQLFEAA